MASECNELCDSEWWLTATAPEILNVIENADVNALDENRSTPLHWAVTVTPEIVAMLLKAGADVNARSGVGFKFRPLHQAVAGTPTTGTPEIVAMLLKADADVNARDGSNATPLHWAKYGTPEIVEMLLKAGADVNARDQTGLTPLHTAAGAGTPEIVEMLLKAGADGSARDESGETPFERAKTNTRLANTNAFWELNDARFK